MKKTMILIDNLYEQYGIKDTSATICFLPLMKKNSNNKFYRIIRKIHLSSVVPFKSIWFNPKWQKIIEEYDTIVLGDTGSVDNVVSFFEKKYKDKRVIVWYRNSVEKTISPDKLEKYDCELWSFDKKDCEKYQLKYNPQFYMYSSQFKQESVEYDAFFIGQNKGRLEKLLEIEEKLQSLGCKTKFLIVGYNSQRLSYDDVLKYISKSRIIIDFQCDWQEGITLRPLEALFYKKKLITNNSNIEKFDFYNKQNIFIWGKNSEKELDDFLKADYVNIDKKIINNYTLESWVQKFLNGVK